MAESLMITNKTKLTPVEIQQEYFENLPECDWVKYEKKNRNYLLQIIAYALYGTPDSEGELSELHDNETVHLEGYGSRQKEQVMKVYEQICDQSKYSLNNEDILISVLLVVLASPKPLRFYEIESSKHWIDLHRRVDINIGCTAVFKIRKCIPTTVGAKSCKVYVDEYARVYKDWDSFLLENTYHKCVLIVPENGEYNGELLEGGEDFAVKLSVVPSPALGLKAKVLSSADTVSTLASIGSIGVLGVAAFTPVGSAVVAGAMTVTVATGVYGLVRSSLHLHDRRDHEQTISPTDPEARNSWLNIAASSVGLSAGAAASLLSKSAAAGTNLTKTGQVLAMSVEVLRHANLLTGGAGVINGLYHCIMKYHKHGETPTTLELFQLSTSLLFFCHAVASNRTAQQIIEDAQAKTINEYRATLRSNRHRKIFDKISAETRRTAGTIQGNTEVINGIKNIGNKDQFFADVLKINKDVNQHKLRISMTSDGNVNINSQNKFNPTDLYNMPKEQRSELFNKIGPADVTTRNVSTKLSSPLGVNRVDSEEESNNNLIVGVHVGEVIRVGDLFIRISASGVEGIASLLEKLSSHIYNDLITVCMNLLSKLLPEEIIKLKLLNPDKDLLWQIVEFVFNYLKHKRPLGEPCAESDNGIYIVLKEFFQNGYVREETILLLKDRLMKWVRSKLDENRRRYPNKSQVICDICKGVTYLNV